MQEVETTSKRTVMLQFSMLKDQDLRPSIEIISK